MWKKAMKKLSFFYPDGHEKHFAPGHPERPERVDAIVKSLASEGLWEKGTVIPPVELSLDQLSGVHDSSYLDNAQKIASTGGYLDADTYTTPDSWNLALNAAGGAVAVARSVWSGDSQSGFALTRPPGHHATIYRGMGFCLLNNIAIAANDLIMSLGAEKLAIIDIDLHHGNGTQDIFYNREDVMFVSLHQSPLYPGSGSFLEIGESSGIWKTLNIPLSPYTGDDAYNFAFDKLIIPLLNEFSPNMILVSYGFDAHWRDPLGSLILTKNGYYNIINLLLEFAKEYCQGRLAVFLEGGYDLIAAGQCSNAIVSALLEKAMDNSRSDYSGYENKNWQKDLERILYYWDSRI